jgi:hypothetical protein
MRFDKRYKIHQAAAKDAGRYQVASIKLELDPPTLIATTGRICAVVPCTVNGTDTEGLIPRQAIADAVKGKQALEAELVRAEPQPDGTECVDVYQAGELTSSHKLTEGNFPRWQEVIPAKAGDDIRLCLNPYLLVELAKAIGCPSTAIGVELRFQLVKEKGDLVVADKPIRVTACEADDAFGVIMPVNRA